MMRKKISFLIFDHSGAPLRKIAISKRNLSLMGICAVAFVAFFIFATIDYVSLNQFKTETGLLKNKLAHQSEKISQQETQIQMFADKINELKSELVTLNDFEKQIRIMANIDSTEEEQEGVFGVGGSLPEDIDPSVGLKERPLGLLQEMHEQVQDLNVAYDAQQDRFRKLFSHLEEHRNLLAATPAIKPVDGGWYSSSFGYRKSPFTGRREFHKGLDISAKRGTPIYATGDGVIVYSGNKGLMGKTIVIDHGYGLVTRYGHAKELLKKKGDRVKRGDVIAKVGNTGRSTGPHVHYEVKVDGVRVNPKNYILN